MSRLLIKVAPERDLYVLWTSVADGPITTKALQKERKLRERLLAEEVR